ncbi:MAG TPA: WecB/TagA/CpsF family glycosyltransferase [Acidimicrobiia bacterium]|nr:WecB/TagA/CpsF family glycosyltransferase [Acidimicrobiia bacterium]
MTGAAVTPPKADVVGIPISMTSMPEVVALLATPPRDRAAVIAVCNVHSVMSARRDPVLGAAIREATIATPDGMPLVWAIRAGARPDQARVAGPDLIVEALRGGVETGLRHFFYGTTPETLDALRSAIRGIDERVEVVGMLSPPFGPVTEDMVERDSAVIAASDPQVVWVGLGMPKQELWMAQAASRLPGTTLVGVGAAFDILAGNQPRAPEWMQSAGLEWLFRLAHEPRRLWRRYVWNNPAFLVLLSGQILRSRLRRR